MRAILAILALVAPAQETAPVESYADLLAGVVAAHGEGDLAAAAARLETLLSEEVSATLAEWQRAEVQYALGLVHTAAAQAPADPSGPPPDILEAAPAFESARALAGPGELRLDATYNLGGVFLAEGERLRATIPEIAGAANPGSQQQVVGPPGLPPPGGAADGNDPLERARSAYETSKEHLIERLRADWRDADTRANLELIQRRLKELDELERQREEQQQEQEQEQDQEGEDGEGEEGENQESDEEPEGEDAENQDPSESDAEGDPEQPQPEGGEQPNETEETQPPEGEPEPQPPVDPSELQERHLTREEVMRLLDRLAELEQQREKLDELLRESSRVPVPRDW